MPRRHLRGRVAACASDASSCEENLQVPHTTRPKAGCVEISPASFGAAAFRPLSSHPTIAREAGPGNRSPGPGCKDDEVATRPEPGAGDEPAGELRLDPLTGDWV